MGINVDMSPMFGGEKGFIIMSSKIEATKKDGTTEMVDRYCITNDKAFFVSKSLNKVIAVQGNITDEEIAKACKQLEINPEIPPDSPEEKEKQRKAKVQKKTAREKYDERKAKAKKEVERQKQKKGITVFVGLCGEFMGKKIGLNGAYYTDPNYKRQDWESDRQAEVWSQRGSGCGVVDIGTKEIHRHMANHGGCDCVILEGTLRHLKDGRLKLIATELLN